MRTPDYERGDVRLYLADCRDILPHLNGVEYCDALLTDPPYGIVNEFGENTGNGTRTMQFDWDSPEITDIVLDVLTLCESLLSPIAGCFVFCGGDQFGRILEQLRGMGFIVKPASWVKKCPPPAGMGNWWPSAFELAVYGYKRGAWFGDDDPKRCNVFVEDSYRFGQPGKVDHPTQKPLRLIQKLVESIVPVGGVAIDPFLGSGTTALACARTGRRCIGIEKEPKYFNIACARIDRELDQPRLFPTNPEVQRQAEMFADGD